MDVIYECAQNRRVPDPAKPLQPSLMFVPDSEAGAYPFQVLASIVKLLALP
jgi:hypothetical protein